MSVGLIGLPLLQSVIISIPLCQSVSNMSSMEYALKSVSGLADVGDGDGPRSPPDGCMVQ